MTPRLFLPSLALLDIGPSSAPPPQLIPLDEASAHHLLRVLRHREGDTLEIFDGRGRAWQAELIDGRAATVRLLQALPPQPEPPVRLCLAQCLSTADKMDWTIEKAVELGVDEIVPLQSARSVVKLDANRAEKRLAHWQRLIAAASMQCRRNRLPTLQPVQALGTWLKRLGPVQAGEHRWVLWPEAERSLAAQIRAQAYPSSPRPGDMAPTSSQTAPRATDTALPPDHMDIDAGSHPGMGAGSHSSTARNPAQPFRPGEAIRRKAPPTTQIDDAELGKGSPIRSAWLLCGPESGLSADEVELAIRNTWQPALLGPRVLRTETAGLVGLTVLQTLIGDLR
ncbi:MAG: RsmE family RNA methyltransferase [Lautropia sp.]|nr:RsmE family RNA methyltransferase [Lautropia sp.]